MEFFVKNLKSLCELHSQRKIAQETGVSPATVNNYIKGVGEPSLSFLIKLKKKYDLNLDDFLTKEVVFIKNQTVSVQFSQHDRFIGNYICYYYDSSSYKGMASNFSKNTLRYGIISVIKQKDEKLKTFAFFQNDREEAEVAFNELSKFKKENISDFLNFYLSDFENCYEGTLDETRGQVFINLRNKFNQDQSLIILNNPPSNKDYIGGLGTVNSVSRGREHMPCVQYIIISDKILERPDGQIYNLLALGVSNVNVHNESEQLLQLFKNLYGNPGETLSDFQKIKIFEDSLSNIVLDLIDANIFRFAKVSNMEDDGFYRMIRDE
ncbi:MAG: helix-turn-helix transcriptional regulator [Clostridia bacterium]